MKPGNEAGEALVLLIEDDGQIRRVVRTALESNGLQVRDAATAWLGLKTAEETQPNLVILDLGLPDSDGLEVSRRLREWSEVPILVLSARSQEMDKVTALNMGADDYLTKPFGMNELLARVRALLRRAENVGRPERGQFSQGDLKVDFLKRLVTRSGQEVHLTPVEYKLLSSMIRGRGKVMTHRQLLREVWGGAHGEDAHYVRIYMAQLRRKLEDDPAQPKLLLTETGVGYRLAEAEG